MTAQPPAPRCPCGRRSAYTIFRLGVPGSEREECRRCRRRRVEVAREYAKRQIGKR